MEAELLHTYSFNYENSLVTWTIKRITAAKLCKEFEHIPFTVTCNSSSFRNAFGSNCVQASSLAHVINSGKPINQRFFEKMFNSYR